MQANHFVSYPNDITAEMHPVSYSYSHASKLYWAAAHYHGCNRMASTVASNMDAGDPSSSTCAYPFPTHKHPTPYEIFHLKPGANPRAIKDRYYQLVRLHHPDAPYARKLPSDISHARFQAIQAAHDVLTGKSPRHAFPSPMYNRARTHSHPPGPRASPHWGASGPAGMGDHKFRSSHYTHNTYAEWQHSASDGVETEEDKAKDRLVILVGTAAIALTVVPFLTSFGLSEQKHKNAVQNLAQARREAREVGLVRRAEIRRKVRGNELEREYEDRMAQAAENNRSPGQNATS